MSHLLSSQLSSSLCLGKRFLNSLPGVQFYSNDFYCAINYFEFLVYFMLQYPAGTLAWHGIHAMPCDV